MLGGGNPVGGSFTGPAQALEIIGNHAYAYSGEIGVSNSFTDLLSFRTGNYYSVLIFNRIYMEDEAAGDDYTWRIQLNGKIIYQTLMYSNAGNAGQGIGPGVQVIIPPYTQVIAEAKNVADSSTNNVGAMLTGRIYRTRD